MIKFLVDESVEKAVVDFLRKQGYDALYVAENCSGITDDEVLSFANRDNRVLVTNDRDFGELIFLQRKASSGVLLFRSSSEKSSDRVSLVRKLLQSFADRLEGNFVVVSDEKIRIRKLP